MTTAIAEETQTGTPSKPAPVEADLASIFYNETTPIEKPSEQTPPVTAPESGSSATSSTSAVSSEPVKETTPVGTELKESETKEKDLEKGHAAAARRLGSELAELKRETQAVLEENRILKAKLDGTHKEPPAPTPDEIAERAEFKGREEATRPIAIGLYGKDALQEQVYSDESPFKLLVESEAKQSNGRSWSYLEVRHHPQPPIAAMNILARKAFIDKWGEDPRQWVSKIEADLTPRLEEKIKKQLVVPVTGGKAPSVTEVAGSGSPVKHKSIEELFYGKPPAA